MQNTKKVFSINNVKNKKANTQFVEFPDVRYLKDGSTIPVKTLNNLEYLLKCYNITPKYNVIDKEMIVDNFKSDRRSALLTKVYDLQVRNGLNLNRSICDEYLVEIAHMNEVNPFIEFLKENRNNDYDLVYNLFNNCLEFAEEEENNLGYYFTLFNKWLLNVVKMAHNTLENRYSSNGILVLQGTQGCRKSTFARNLMPKKEWFKGDETLEPDNKDNVMRNTNYILVELGELDSTLKGEQAKLKQFITATSDEYRAPYSRTSEKFPRLTSYIGTVNNKGFLKDETGSRRFWIIPVKRCKIEEFEKIDMAKFWGAVYDMWLTNYCTDWLSPSEEAKQREINKDYNFESDITLILNDKIDWDSDDYRVYKLTEIAEKLNIKEKKALANELMKRGIPNQPYKVNGKSIRGYKLPFIRDYWE